MERQPVSSSQIQSVGYDADTQILEVEFKRAGNVYQYAAVPIQEYVSLMHAPSIGKHFNESIRDNYTFQKL